MSKKIEKQRKLWRKKQQAYYENREAWNEYQREYKKRRYSEDPEYRARTKEYARERYKKLKGDAG